MNKAIFRYMAAAMTLVFVIAVVVSSIAITNTLRYQQEKIVEYTLESTVSYAKQNDFNLPTYYNSQIIQIAVIDQEGDIVKYNGMASPTNQAAAGEFVEANLFGNGKEIYYSTQFGQNVLAVAKSVDNYIVRITFAYLGYGQIYSQLFNPLFITYVICLAICYLISILLAKRMIKPINEVASYLEDVLLNEENEDITIKDSEYNIILSKAKRISRRVNSQMRKIQFEKSRINSILDQMKEGFVLLNEKNQVIMANKKARQINSAAFVYKQPAGAFFFDRKILDAIESVDEEIKFDYQSIDRIYSCIITKVEFGVTILFINVTDNRKAIQMRSEFFSNVSHELKTPITAIRGYSDILMAGYIKNPKTLSDIYVKINKESVNMTNLVSDILMISMLENNAIEVEYSDIRLTNVIQDVVEAQSKLIHDKNLAVSVECDDISYHANYKHIHQLFNNLISNACKYNKDNGKVDIKVMEQDTYINIIVSDTGRGIAKNEISRIFERFYRIDDGRDKETGGTGLGLAIVKHIAAHYKGVVTVNSVIGEGSKFVVNLPKKSKGH
ncbi:MAG: ATP-binding protein [Erysipelotrichaceae bacterium]|nr:ATP-binding protein [Erysipelotrichaceae bacterium]